MPSLRELQLAFARDLLAESPPPAPAYLSRADAARRRLNVYRNNFRAGYADALRAAFPVIRRLVGRECFDALAHRHAVRVPSPGGDLARYGGSFPASLGEQPEFRALAGVPPERIPALRLRLHPSVRLLRSGYPVTRVWTVNQDGYDGDSTVRLDEGGERILVHRGTGGVGWRTLRPGGWGFLRAVGDGRGFGEACQAALEEASDFAVDRTLPAMVADGIITGFAPAPVHPPETGHDRRQRP